MKLRPSLLLGAMLLVLGIIASACDGDDRLTLDEYFERFEAIDADADVKIGALYRVFEGEEDLFSNEDNLPLLKELVAGFPVILTDALDQGEELNPPSEAEDAHDEFLATGREWVEVLEDGTDRVEAVESILEAEQLVEELEAAAQETQERFDDACLDLVGIAEASGIVVDVSCEDE